MLADFNIRRQPAEDHRERELGRPVSVLISNQPTRGLDVDSIEYIHSQIVDKRNNGVAVMVTSAELDEIMSLADRIAVMYHGEIVATIDAVDATRVELSLLMAGSHEEDQEEPSSGDAALN